MRLSRVGDGFVRCQNFSDSEDYSGYLWRVWCMVTSVHASWLRCENHRSTTWFRRTHVPSQRERESIHGILAAPPCTEFAVSGSQHWKTKPLYKLRHALIIVHHIERIIEEADPTWWALENPVGRLKNYIGKWAYTFQPWEYGDNYFKRTCIWGTALQPRPTITSEPPRNPKTEWVHRLGPSENRAQLRSVTPAGFALAFFKANP